MPTLVAEFDVRQFEQGVLRIRKGLDTIEREGRAAGSGIDKAFANTKGINTTTQATGRLNTSMRGAATSAGFLRSGLAGIVAGVSFGQVIDELRGFDASMQRALGVTQATQGEFTRLRDLALDLGRETRFSAQEAAEGIVFLGQAGLKTADIIDLLPVSLNLAAGASTGLSRAADVLSNVLSAFQQESSEAADTADVLSATLINSNTNFEQLAIALRQVAPIAANTGTSLEAVSAAVGVLGNNAIQGEQAGTALRAIILSLVDPSKDAAGAIQSLGLTLDDVNPEKAGLIKAFNALKEANLGTAEASTIFGREAAAAAAVLVNQVGSVEDLVAVLEEADGTSKELADTLNDSLEGAILGTQSAFSGLIQAIGDSGVTDALTAGFRNAADALNQFTDDLRNGQSVASSFFTFIGREASDGLSRLTGGLLDIGPALESVDRFFFDAARSVVSFIDDIVDLKDVFFNFDDVLDDIAASIRDTLADAFDAAADAVDRLVSVLPKSVRDLVGLGDEAEDTAESLEDLDDSALGAQRRIRDLSQSAGDLSNTIDDGTDAADEFDAAIQGLGFSVNGLSGQLPSLSDAFDVTFDNVNSTIRSIDIDGVIDLTRDALDFIGFGFEDVFGNKVGPIVEDFVRLVDRNLDTIKSIVGGVFDFLGIGFGKATDDVVIFGQQAIQSFTGAGNQAGVLSGQIGGIQGSIQGVIGSTGGMAAAFAAVFAVGTVGFLDLKDKIGGVGATLLGVVNPAILTTNGLLKLLGIDTGKVFSFIKDAAVKAFDTIKGAATATFNAVKSVAQGFQSALQSIAQTITSAFSAAFNAIRNVATATFNAVAGVVRTVGGVITGIFNTIRNIATAAFNAIAGAARALGGAIGGVFNNILGIGKSVFGSLVGAAQSAFNGIISAAKAAAGTVGGILGGITGGIGKVTSGLGGIGGGIISGGKKIFKGAKKTLKKLNPFAEGGVITGPTTLAGPGLAGKRFRTGGVLDFPTLLGNPANTTQTKNLGLAGEAGPEGILPLTETSKGLGVSAVGVGGNVTKVFIIEGVDRAETDKLKRRLTRLDASVEFRSLAAIERRLVA